MIMKSRVDRREYNRRPGSIHGNVFSGHLFWYQNKSAFLNNERFSRMTSAFLNNDLWEDKCTHPQRWIYRCTQ